MTQSIAIALLLSLSFAACGKEETVKVEPKIVAPGTQAGSTEAPKAEPPAEVPATAAEAPPAPAFAIENVHAHLKAGGKLKAVKEYRELHGKLALNASKLGVEVEQEKLGMPSTMDVHKLYFAGKKDEALNALAALYKQPTDAKGVQDLWGDIDKMGPATEDNLKAKAAAGQSTAALAIYHHLHPETPVPEAWAAVQASMGK